MRKVKFTKKLFELYPNEIIVEPNISYNHDGYESAMAKLTSGDYDTIRMRGSYKENVPYKFERYYISNEDKDRYLKDFENSFVGKNKYEFVKVKSIKERPLYNVDEFVYKYKKPKRNFSDLSLPFEETYKKHSDRGYGQEFLDGYNSIDNHKNCPYRSSGYKRASWEKVIIVE